MLSVYLNIAGLLESPGKTCWWFWKSPEIFCKQESGNPDYITLNRNDEMRRMNKHPNLTAIIQSRHLSLFGHIVQMTMQMPSRLPHLRTEGDRFTLASRGWTPSSEIWELTYLTLTEAVNLAQNCPLWRLMSTPRGACRKEEEVHFVTVLAF